MTSVPPPHGLNEIDYETIEAAVTETVRGRWFLAEFARRNRLAETRQLLDAMARIEAAVSGHQIALPTADPSIRLLIQRIKEIAGQLGTVAGEMRDAGIDDRFVGAVDLQARAVAGMMRSATPVKSALTAPDQTVPEKTVPGMTEPGMTEPDLALPDVAPAAAGPVRDLSPAPQVHPPQIHPPRVELTLQADDPGRLDDPRLALLSGLDGLPLAQKLALFS